MAFLLSEFKKQFDDLENIVKGQAELINVLLQEKSHEEIMQISYYLNKKFSPLIESVIGEDKQQAIVDIKNAANNILELVQEEKRK